MKNTDKVTLTVAQLKKLVSESKKRSIKENEDSKWLNAKTIRPIVDIFGTTIEKVNSILVKLELAGEISDDVVEDVDKALNKISELMDRLESKYLLRY